ncbi:MAG: Uma2 family endonuclease [Planctomycetales bacterium]|nr:Uma2 family endonuclease [Planctomycetales bacterium]
MIATELEPLETLADLMEQLGNVPLERIRLHPFPGTATVEDVLRLCDREPKRLCELVDGVLVEKVMGHQESRLAARLIFVLQSYLEEQDLGIVSGADGPHQILFDQVRFPDVAYIAYDRIPEGADPSTPVPDWIPTIAVEILSRSNTKAEMTRKLRDYFEAGVELVWYVDPSDRTVRVYHSLEAVTTLTDADDLDGEQLLPGFRLSIRDWFDRASRIRPNA